MTDRNDKEELSPRRSVFSALMPGACTNTGLWLERYPAKLGKRGETQVTLEAVCGKDSPIRVPPEYRMHFDRRKHELEKVGALIGHAKVQARMIVGLGAESVLETSITLHRIYGVPMIPGAALKGLASSAAHRLFSDEKWQRNGESHKIMFGEKDSAGYVTFHDALYVPSKHEERLPLDLDVMTVHHRGYYGTGNEPPADWDSPIPVPFLTAHGEYLIAIEGPQKWAIAAWNILQTALLEEGIGAKTAAGYGRMALEQPEAILAEEKRIKLAETRITQAVGRFAGKSNARQVLDTILEFADDETMRDAIRTAMRSLYDNHKDFWRDWRKNPESAHWDVLQKLDLAPPAPAVSSAARPERQVEVPGPTWERGLAWIARDKKNHRLLYFLRPGEKKPEDRKCKDLLFVSDGIEGELERATAQDPKSVDVLREGQKMKQIRRVQ